MTGPRNIIVRAAFGTRVTSLRLLVRNMTHQRYSGSPFWGVVSSSNCKIYTNELKAQYQSVQLRWLRECQPRVFVNYLEVFPPVPS